MKNKKMIILVGNIGSGKSTYIKKELVPKGYVVVSRDSIRYMIGGGDYIFNPKLEPSIFQSETDILINFMCEGVNIVVDEVGINKRLRAKYIKLAKLESYKINAIVMPKLSMSESVTRRMNNPHGQPDKKLWENVWKKFDDVYEEPTIKEGFNKVTIYKKCITCSGTGIYRYHPDISPYNFNCDCSIKSKCPKCKGKGYHK